MATIAQIVAQIRTAVFGKDVRENIAQGIEKCYADVEELTDDCTELSVNLKSAFTTETENEGYIELFGGVNRSLSGGGTGASCISFSNIADKYTFNGIYTSSNTNNKWFGLLSKPQITRAGTSAGGYSNFDKQISLEANHVYKVSSKLISGSVVGNGVSLRVYDADNNQLISNGAKIGEVKYFTINTNKMACLAVRVDIDSGFSNATISVTLQDVTKNVQPMVFYPTGDDTDRTDEITLALNRYGCAILAGNGYYYTTGITMPDDSEIIGFGGAIIVLDPTANRSAVGMHNRCKLLGVNIFGDTEDIELDGTITDRRGVNFEGNQTTAGGPENCIIDNCTIAHFSGAGIRCYRTSMATVNCLSVTNCHIYNCNAGVHIQQQSEFHRFSNNNIRKNYYGVINNGGNNIFSNCAIGYNMINLSMGDDGVTYQNHGHGMYVGCELHHSGDNGSNGIAIQLKYISSTFVFTGLNIAWGSIILSHCSTILFNSCRIHDGVKWYIDAGNKHVVSNSLMANFSEENDLILTSNGSIDFINCYRPNGKLVAEKTPSSIVDYSATYIRGGYIATSGSTADINTTVENAEYGHCIIPCEEGDRFMTASFGQSTPRKWAFLSEPDAETGLCTVLKKADAMSGQRNNRFLNYVEIEAPRGSAYLVCNHRYYSELGYSPVVIKMSNDDTVNEIAKKNHTIPCRISPLTKRCIVAAYDKYLVKLESNKLSRSDDCGVTWGNEMSVSSISGYITSYHLFANGSLAFFTNTKAYYTDNFETFSEAVCYEADGETVYTPATYENFFNNSEVAERKFIDGQDMYVFGNYVLTGLGETRILIWYTIDGGHTYKIAYEFNLPSTYPARHVHTVNYYESKDLFICCTGDSNATECRVFAMEYDVENDSWSTTVLGGSSRNYKWAHLGIWNDEIYFSYDNTPGAVYKCKYDDIGDPTKWVAVLEGTDSDVLEVRFSARGEMIVTQSVSRSTGGASPSFSLSRYKSCRKIHYSADRKHFTEIFVDPQIVDSYTALSRVLPVTADGHLIAHAHGYDRDNWNGTPSVYLDEYVRLAGFNDAFRPL